MHRLILLLATSLTKVVRKIHEAPDCNGLRTETTWRYEPTVNAPVDPSLPAYALPTLP